MVGKFVVAAHAGAGLNRKSTVATDLKHALADICDQVLKQLESGLDALDACCLAVSLLENHPQTNAGTGSNLCIDGSVECDASVMTSVDRNFGACAAVQGVKNPVMLAKAIHNGRLNTANLPLGLVPPMILSGEGAKQFAAESCLEVVAPEVLITEKQKNRRDRLLRSLSSQQQETDESVELDTVGAIVLDGNGRIAAASSSGGLLLKHRGRVGQAAIFGAGVWAEDREGLAVGCSVSGTGEQLIESSLAKSVAQSLLCDDFVALPEVLSRNLLSTKSVTGNRERYMGLLALQVFDSGKEHCSGTLHVAHTAPTFCWGYRTSGSPAAKAYFDCKESGDLSVTGISF